MDTLVGKLKATASNITSMFDALTLSRRLKLKQKPGSVFPRSGLWHFDLKFFDASSIHSICEPLKLMR
jgi:hypothetical protein